MANRQRGERFFRIMAWLLLAIVLGGFVGVQISPISITTASLTPMIALHGAVFLGWYALLVAQPYWIKAGDIERHKQFGGASLLLAVAIVILGYLTVRGAYAKPEWQIAMWSHDGSTLLPVLDITTFVLAYTLATFHRATPPSHKRLMLLAGMFMIDPAMARLVAAIGAPSPLIPLAELALFLALPVYDWRTRGKPHWASLMGLAIFVIAMALKMGVAESAAWTGFAPLLFG